MDSGCTPIREAKSPIKIAMVFITCRLHHQVSCKVKENRANRIANRIAALEAARDIGDLNTPSLRVHKLAGRQRGRFAIWVNGPWRMTFRFRAETVSDLDLEQYH